MKFVGKDKPDDQHYKTVLIESKLLPECITNPDSVELQNVRKVAKKYAHKFREEADGHVFGTIARRADLRMDKWIPGFITTARGKRELEDWTYVPVVDHVHRVVLAGPKKATLNAPLLERLFHDNTELDLIVHYHEFDSRYSTLAYGEPGTKADSLRDIPKGCKGFNIEDHGLFLLFYHPVEILQ